VPNRVGRCGRDQMTSTLAESKQNSLRKPQFKPHILLQSTASLPGFGRFSFRLLEARCLVSASSSPSTDCPMDDIHVNNTSVLDRRSRPERRVGGDNRLDEDKFLQGERRSGVNRRWSASRRSSAYPEYRSFKKARTFARHLGLHSAQAWHDYAKSEMKPTDIPAAPHHVYADEGWVGWSDWLGTSKAIGYVVQHPIAKTLNAIMRRFDLVANH
jgi:hypothetical protein